MMLQEQMKPTARAVSDIDTKLEVVVIPVSNVDRAKQFYTGPGWRLDTDVPGKNGFRVVQKTPPGSSCSVIFGSNITATEQGSIQGLHLIVSDIGMAHATLAHRGVVIGGIFHDAGGVFHHKGADDRLPGPHSLRASYGSYTSFSDPDGNGWVLQEITTRLPGRIDASAAAFASAGDLVGALRRAAAAHGEHEKRVGGNHDETWPDRYSELVVAERAASHFLYEGVRPLPARFLRSIDGPSPNTIG